jgi:hypothetical protein
MALHHRDLPLDYDCPLELAKLPADASGTGRYCSACNQTVHDLSAMTEQQAAALLRARASEQPCVSFQFHADGRVRFAEPPRIPTSRLRPRPRMRMELAAAALLASLTVGCVGFNELEIDEPDELDVLATTEVVPWADPDAPACAPEDTPDSSPLVPPSEPSRPPSRPPAAGDEPITIAPPREPHHQTEPLPVLPDDEDLEVDLMTPLYGSSRGRMGRIRYPALVDMELLRSNPAERIRDDP